jgi:hypothetical protein
MQDNLTVVRSGCDRLLDVLLVQDALAEPKRRRVLGDEPAAAVDSDHQFLTLEDDFVVLPGADLTANFPSRPISRRTVLLSVMSMISRPSAILRSPPLVWPHNSITQQMRAHRARRRRREVQLTIEVSEIDLREIALAGYADAASTDPEGPGPGGSDIRQRPVLRAAPRERCGVTVTP